MKSIDNIIMFQNLQADVWGYATTLLDILQWFDGEEATDRAITQGLLVDDAKDRFVMWCDLANVHYNTWTEWMKTIDLDSVDRELFDDCPDDVTLSNRLRIVKLRAGAMWHKEEYDKVCHKLIYSFFRIKALVLATYEIEDKDAHKLATQIKNRLTNRFINVHMMQGVVQSIIDKGEQILNPHPTPTETEQGQDKPQQISNELEYLLGINGIKIAFDMLQEQGYMRAEGEYFRWLKENDLLAYFCEKLYNQFLTLTKGNKSWGYFSNVFIAKGTGGKDVIPKGNKINRYKTDWKADRLLDKEDPFCPDGSKDIDLLIAMAKQKAEQ